MPPDSDASLARRFKHYQMENRSKYFLPLSSIAGMIVSCILFLGTIFWDLWEVEFTNMIGTGMFCSICSGVILVGGLMHHFWVKNLRTKFQSKLANLPFDRLKVKLTAHPDWLEELPNHTEEMAVIAITSDPTVIGFTRCDSVTFWIQIAQIYPAIVARRFNKVSFRNMNQNTCQIWRELLKISPEIFLEHMPSRFPHLEYEIYFDLVRLDPNHIHRVPLLKLQERIRTELKLSL